MATAEVDITGIHRENCPRFLPPLGNVYRLYCVHIRPANSKVDCGTKIEALTGVNWGLWQKGDLSLNKCTETRGGTPVDAQADIDAANKWIIRKVLS